MKWYKTSNIFTIDPLVAVIASKAKCFRHEVIALWIHLMEHAAQNSVDYDGNMGKIDFEIIDFALELLPGKAQKIYQAFEDKGKIHAGCIANWRKYQADDSNAERQRRFREKKKSNGDVTLRNVTGVTNNGVTLEEKRREENKEKIIKKKSYFFDPVYYKNLKQKMVENSWSVTSEEKTFIKEYEENQVKQMRK